MTAVSESIFASDAVSGSTAAGMVAVGVWQDDSTSTSGAASQAWRNQGESARIFMFPWPGRPSAPAGIRRELCFEATVVNSAGGAALHRKQPLALGMLAGQLASAA